MQKSFLLCHKTWPLLLFKHYFCLIYQFSTDFHTKLSKYWMSRLAKPPLKLLSLLRFWRQNIGKRLFCYSCKNLALSRKNMTSVIWVGKEIKSLFQFDLIEKYKANLLYKVQVFCPIPLNVPLILNMCSLNTILAWSIILHLHTSTSSTVFYNSFVLPLHIRYHLRIYQQLPHQILA